MPLHRPRRLTGVAYVGPQRYFITTCTQQRIRAFASADVALSAIGRMRDAARKHQLRLFSFCFMPDHAHILALGDADCADLEAFVKLFKQCTGYDYKRQTGRQLWQVGYYDRILRNDEDTREVARYVLANPIRAGLTKTIGEYPFAGSDEFDVRGL